MCLSTLYGIRNEKKEKLGEFISNMATKGSEYVFTDVMGNEFSVRGSIRSLDLVRNEIIMELENREPKKYELIREIYNKCSGNQMRDVFVSNPETDDPEGYVRDMLEGKSVTLNKQVLQDGTVIIDADVSGLQQRFTFSPD